MDIETEETHERRVVAELNSEFVYAMLVSRVAAKANMGRLVGGTFKLNDNVESTVKYEIEPADGGGRRLKFKVELVEDKLKEPVAKTPLPDIPEDPNKDFSP